jgi:hypothetical protein
MFSPTKRQSPNVTLRNAARHSCPSCLARSAHEASGVAEQLWFGAAPKTDIVGDCVDFVRCGGEGSALIQEPGNFP